MSVEQFVAGEFLGAVVDGLAADEVGCVFIVGEEGVGRGTHDPFQGEVVSAQGKAVCLYLEYKNGRNRS